MGKKNFNPKPQLEAAPAASLENVTGSQTSSKSEISDDVAKGAGTKGSAVSVTEVKEEVLPKPVVNTKKVAELVSGGAAPSIGVAAPVARAAGRINYSGSADNIMGDKSAIAEGKSVRKSGDRPGRMIDTALQHIDDAPAETYVVPVQTIPNITGGASAVGYNGKYRNAHLVSQKGSGGSPADADFFRTLDECQYDNMYFGVGQHVFTSEEQKSLTVSSFDNSTTPGSWTEGSVAVGNFIARKMIVKFGSNKKVESISFETANLTPEELTDEHVARAAADTLLREENKYELDRLAMIDKAGDETKDNWSPLGKVTPNARAVNSVISEIDKIIGDYMFLSGSKLSTALAYQNNKAAKDGIRKVAPMFEMLEGNCEGSTHRFEDAGFDGEAPTVTSLCGTRDSKNPFMAKGSAAMYIQMMDSVAKYNTKGKVLSLPLSFKTAISTFRQNCGEFRAHSTFIHEFDRQETFGKVDSDGSGLTPYFISDGAALIEPVDIFNDILLSKSTSSDPILRLHYEDLRNEYNVPVYNYLLSGLQTYIARYAGKICDAIAAQTSGDDQGKYIWTVPIVSTTTCLSMWDVLLCAAAKDVAIARRYALDIICQYEAANGYPYHDATKLSDLTIGGTSGVGFKDISEPLVASIIPLNVATRIMLPELFWVKAYGEDQSMDGVGGVTTPLGTVGSVVLPWYFSENAFQIVQNNEGKNFVWEPNFEELNSMTFFDYRGGVTFGNAERIAQLDPEQLKLSLDRMVIAPAMHKQIDQLALEELKPTVFKYSYHEDGIPVMLYYIASKDAGDADHRLTILDVLSTPRELGLSFVAPSGVVTGNSDGTDLNYRSLESSYFVTSGPSFRIRVWSSTPVDTVASELFDSQRSDNYAVNLMAHYYTIYAQPGNAIKDIGIKVSVNTTAGGNLSTENLQPEVMVVSNSAYVHEAGTYSGSQIEIGGITDADAASVLGSSHVSSMLKYLYTRLNYLPFIVNPFDVNSKEFTGSETTASKKMTTCNSYDIFDFLHLFNMCGFRCGEYSGIAYDRDRQRIELGLGYVSDPYIEHRA